MVTRFYERRAVALTGLERPSLSSGGTLRSTALASGTDPMRPLRSASLELLK